MPWVRWNNHDKTPHERVLMSDPRIPLAAVLDQAGALITTTDPADAGLATPCEEFDVAHLIDHMVAIPFRIAHVAEGGLGTDVPSSLDVAPSDWASQWAQGRARVDAALADDGVLTREFKAPFGNVPGAVALNMYVTEFLVHGWDLAKATGRLGQLNATLGDAVATAALPNVRRAIPADARGTIPFAEVVEVGDDASPFDQLLGWYGRDPR